MENIKGPLQKSLHQGHILVLSCIFHFYRLGMIFIEVFYAGFAMLFSNTTRYVTVYKIKPICIYLYSYIIYVHVMITDWFLSVHRRNCTISLTENKLFCLVIIKGWIYLLCIVFGIYCHFTVSYLILAFTLWELSTFTGHLIQPFILLRISR